MLRFDEFVVSGRILNKNDSACTDVYSCSILTNPIKIGIIPT